MSNLSEPECINPAKIKLSKQEAIFLTKKIINYLNKSELTDLMNEIAGHLSLANSNETVNYNHIEENFTFKVSNTANCSCNALYQETNSMKSKDVSNSKSLTESTKNLYKKSALKIIAKQCGMKLRDLNMDNSNLTHSKSSKETHSRSETNKLTANFNQSQSNGTLFNINEVQTSCSQYQTKAGAQTESNGTGCNSITASLFMPTLDGTNFQSESLGQPDGDFEPSIYHNPQPATDIPVMTTTGTTMYKDCANDDNEYSTTSTTTAVTTTATTFKTTLNYGDVYQTDNLLNSTDNVNPPSELVEPSKSRKVKIRQNTRLDSSQSQNKLYSTPTRLDSSQGQSKLYSTTTCSESCFNLIRSKSRKSTSEHKLVPITASKSVKFTDSSWQRTSRIYRSKSHNSLMRLRNLVQSTLPHRLMQPWICSYIKCCHVNPGYKALCQICSNQRWHIHGRFVRDTLCPRCGFINYKTRRNCKKCFIDFDYNPHDNRRSQSNHKKLSSGTCVSTMVFRPFR